MYQVMIVDDEASASHFIQQIIEKKCPKYKVAYIAENGQGALEKLKEIDVDVVISDIRMPVMDGILLMEIIKEQNPDICRVLISGYQEFAYAQKALRAGVSEYLLKPVKPRELQGLMEKLCEALDARYYEHRIRLFNNMVKDSEVADIKELKRYFERGRYYAILVRRKGLPRRFSSMTGVPIYSLLNERFFIYGRDEMEALYLVNEKYLVGKSASDMAREIMKRLPSQNQFVTGIVHSKAFHLLELQRVLKDMYRRLDYEIVIGKNQLIDIHSKSNQDVQPKKTENRFLEKAEFAVRFQEIPILIEAVEGLFALWEKEERSQVYVEKQVGHILYLLYNRYKAQELFTEMTFFFDEAFAYVENMEELRELVIQMLWQLDPNGKRETTNNKEELFREMTDYLEQHLHEEITLSGLCHYFGISQTSLGRLFRSKEGCSFSNYLMNRRIARAKLEMDKNPDCYIKDVAEKVGYKDQFYFSRIFRSVSGMSPSEYLETRPKEC